MEVWFYTLVSVFIVSLVSLVGIFAFSVNMEKMEKALIYLVSLSVGTLLGGAFLHLIPEAFEGNSQKAPFYVLVGIILFFVLEKFIHWNHCHDSHCKEHSGRKKVFSYSILIGDGLHNFIDGMMIAASYLISIPLGIVTTIAVIFHEIPQEIGDFGTLVYAGFSKAKALMFNFLSALTAIVGAVVVLVVGFNSEVADFLLPLTAGGFIYVAVADLIPELHKTPKARQSFWQLVFLFIGLAIMAGLMYIE